MALNLLAGVATLLVQQTLAQDQLTTAGCVDAVDQLVELHSWAVTSEDYPVFWPGDIRPEVPNMVLRRYEWVKTTYDAADGALPLVRSACEEHNRRELPIQYKVEEDDWGVHIVPVRVRDAEGIWVAAHPPLNTVVTLEPGRRSVAVAMGQLFLAIQEAGGAVVKGPTLYDPGLERVVVDVPGAPMVARDLLMTFLDAAEKQVGGPGFAYRLAWLRDYGPPSYLLNLWLLPPPRKPSGFEVDDTPCHPGDDDCIDTSVPGPYWQPTPRPKAPSPK